MAKRPVQRKKAAAASKTRRRRPVKAKKSSGSGLMIAMVAALVIIIGVGYLIFSGDEKVETKKRALPIAPAEVLPEKPEPNWSYESNLKTKEVVVDVPEKKKAKLDYQMQCGSFRVESDANALKARIAFQGLNSRVRKTGDWYRVILGPYKRKRLAEKERHKLQRAKINGCAIWLWR